jgi:chromosome segregation ATPase
LTIEELEHKIEKFTKERHKLEEKKLQLNLYLDIYMKEKNNANVTYEEITGPFERIIGNDPLMNQIKTDGENELLNINNRAIEELNNQIKDLSQKISIFLIFDFTINFSSPRRIVSTSGNSGIIKL